MGYIPVKYNEKDQHYFNGVAKLEKVFNARLEKKQGIIDQTLLIVKESVCSEAEKKQIKGRLYQTKFFEIECLKSKEDLQQVRQTLGQHTLSGIDKWELIEDGLLRFDFKEDYGDFFKVIPEFIELMSKLEVERDALQMFLAQSNINRQVTKTGFRGHYNFQQLKNADTMIHPKLILFNFVDEKKRRKIIEKVLEYSNDHDLIFEEPKETMTEENISIFFHPLKLLPDLLVKQPSEPQTEPVVEEPATEPALPTKEAPEPIVPELKGSDPVVATVTSSVDPQVLDLIRFAIEQGRSVKVTSFTFEVGEQKE